MNITVNVASPFAQKLPAIVLFAFEKERPAAPAAFAKTLRSLSAKEFSGAAKQLTILHTSPRLLLVGLGKRDAFNHEILRRAVGGAVRKLRDNGLDRAAVQVRDADHIAPIVDAAILADYRFTEFKAPDDNHADVKALTLCLPVKADLAAAKTAVKRAQAIAESANYTRAIANLPGNVITPVVLASEAEKLARSHALDCTILDKPALIQAGFGGLLAVGGGSENDPRLIVLEYNGGDSAPIALVGKAITFDSGGISIKPSDKMDEMKFDKCGGCAVLGAMRAIAELKLPVNVLGIIAAAENMPSATSYRPGDIVTSYKGKDKRGVTIEVLNTDAEGRIVLGDALAYARERGASEIIDLATLTGACVVALGTTTAGLISNNEALQEKLRTASRNTGEQLWPLPLWQEYKDKIKSDVADIKNTGGREGGTITAAAFLAKYVGDTPWAHLDIAGTAWTTTDHPYFGKGATAFGVRLLLDFLSQPH